MQAGPLARGCAGQGSANPRRGGCRLPPVPHVPALAGRLRCAGGAEEEPMTIDYEPYSHRWKDDPYTAYRQLRDEAPVIGPAQTAR